MNNIKNLNIYFTDTFLHDKWHLKDITINEDGLVVLHTISVNKPYPIITKYDASSFYNKLLESKALESKAWIVQNQCKIITYNKPFDILFNYKNLPSLIQYFDTNLPMYLI